MPYDVTVGFGLNEPPELHRISNSESDGSCTTLKNGKEWWLREFETWCDEQKELIRVSFAADIQEE